MIGSGFSTEIYEWVWFSKILNIWMGGVWKFQRYVCTQKYRKRASPKDDLYLIWLKLTSWFWWRFCFKFRIFLLSWVEVWTILNPLSLWMICAKSGYNWPSGFGEEVENVKVYRQTDRHTDRQTTDNGWSEISSGELKIIWKTLQFFWFYRTTSWLTIWYHRFTWMCQTFT
jgi:hypothetical protein